MQKFVFHNFDNVTGKQRTDRINPLKNINTNDRVGKISALFAAAEGDLAELRKLLLSGIPATSSDYDGRTLLHLAASEGHLNIVKYLLKHHVVDVEAADRWGGTALSDARDFPLIADLLKTRSDNTACENRYSSN